MNHAIDENWKSTRVCTQDPFSKRARSLHTQTAILHVMLSIIDCRYSTLICLKVDCNRYMQRFNLALCTHFRTNIRSILTRMKLAWDSLEKMPSKLCEQHLISKTDKIEPEGVDWGRGGEIIDFTAHQ